MALRKKGLKVAVTAMAIISVITSGGLNNIYADGSIDKNITVIERTLEDKVYSVANKIEYVKDRSEERRVGKECTSWCRSRWSPYH